MLERMLRRAGNIWYAIELVCHRSWVKTVLNFIGWIWLLNWSKTSCDQQPFSSALGTDGRSPNKGIPQSSQVLLPPMWHTHFHITIQIHTYVSRIQRRRFRNLLSQLEEYFHFILQVRNVRNIPYIMPYCARVNAYQRHVIICHIVLHLAMV